MGCRPGESEADLATLWNTLCGAGRLLNAMVAFACLLGGNPLLTHQRHPQFPRLPARANHIAIVSACDKSIYVIVFKTVAGNRRRPRFGGRRSVGSDPAH